MAKALVLVSEEHPAWTRHDLLKQLALVLPAETRRMSPEEAQELLLGLAEEALSGRSGEVVSLEALIAPQWTPSQQDQPQSLGLEGRAGTYTQRAIPGPKFSRAQQCGMQREHACRIAAYALAASSGRNAPGTVRV